MVDRKEQLGGMMLIFYPERWRQSSPLKYWNKAHSMVYKPERQPTFEKQLLWKPQTFKLQEFYVSIVGIFILKMEAAGSYSLDYTLSIR
jgi:REP element-mobilizing transposase RayT